MGKMDYVKRQANIRQNNYTIARFYKVQIEN